MYSKNLKKIRKQLDLSAQKLADTIGISVNTISAYERNLRTPSLDFGVLLYEKLNINLNWFITGEGEMFNKKEPSVNNDELEQKVVEVMKKYGVIEK